MDLAIYEPLPCLAFVILREIFAAIYLDVLLIMPTAEYVS